MSLKSLRKKLSDGEVIVSVTRKEMSLLLTAKKLSAVSQIISKSVAAQNFFLKSFSGVRSVLLASNPRSLRDQYVKEGLPVAIANLGLQDRQWKMSLGKAFETISSSRAITEDAVREALVRSKLLSEEIHLVRYILKRPEVLQLLLDGDIRCVQGLILTQSKHVRFNPLLREVLGAMNQKRVLLWLRRKYRETHAKHQKPVILKKRTYHLDPNMYSWVKSNETSYIAIASLEPRKRILIPLTNRNLTEKDFSGNIKVVLRRDGKVEIHRTINTVVQKPIIHSNTRISEDEPKVTALDKGFTDLLHCTSGQKYGVGYGVKLAGWSDSIQKRNAGRARMHSLKMELEKKIIILGDGPAHTQEVKKIKKKGLTDPKG